MENTELFGWCLLVGIKPGQEVLWFVSVCTTAILGFIQNSRRSNSLHISRAAAFRREFTACPGGKLGGCFNLLAPQKPCVCKDVAVIDAELTEQWISVHIPRSIICLISAFVSHFSFAQPLLWPLETEQL